jgi:hypothetical protein
MADSISQVTAQVMLTTLTGTTTSIYVQLHTGDPGTAGTGSVSSVTTREAVTWASPLIVGGTIATANASNQPEWTSWAGTSPEVDTDISFWNAITSGVFNMSMPLSSSVTMNTGDSLTLTSISVSIPTAS